MNIAKTFILLIVIFALSKTTIYSQLSYAEGGPSVEDPGLEVNIEFRRYIDAVNGNDANDGKTQATAWKTLSKVNGEMYTFLPGFHILFKRGQSWNGGLGSPDLPHGVKNKRIVFGAYGSLIDARPKFSDIIQVSTYWMARDLQGPRFNMGGKDGEGSNLDENGNHHSIFYSNICFGGSNSGFMVIGNFHHSTIIGNIVYDIDNNDCIVLHAVNWGDYMQYVRSSHWIVDNVIIGNSGMEDGIDVSMEGAGVYAPAPEGDVKIISNRVQMSAVPGLSKRTGEGRQKIILGHVGKYGWVIDNTCSGGSGSGIWISQDQQKYKISGNIVFEGSSNYACLIEGADVFISNNTIYDYMAKSTPVWLKSKVTEFSNNIILRLDGGYWIQTNNDPLKMDYNWWGHSDSPILNGQSFSEWQTSTGFDLNSDVGAVPGITQPENNAYNNDPRNWNDQEFLDQFIPSSEFVGLNGIIPGAFDKDGNRQGLAILPFEESDLSNGGLGWEGPLIVQQRLKELGISWGQPLLAKYPAPKDMETNVLISSTLSWTAGDNTISNDVYLGTHPDSLNFMVNQVGTAYDPGTLAYETAYFWRVDQVTASGTEVGVLWSFTTEWEPIAPVAASTPSPLNSEVEVRTSLLLTWVNGARTISTNIYLGTTNPPPKVGNQTGNSYGVVGLELATKYYWRIDGINDWGTTEGTVWEFTTQVVPTLPEGWASLDIGKVGISGDDDFESNSFIISASGTGIEGNSDQFRFIYHELSGNGEIIARVVSVDNTSSTAMAGVMIREKLDSTSSNGTSALTPANGIKAKWRPFDGLKISAKSGSAVSAPYWVRLQRSGDYIVSYESADGKIWKTLKAEQIKMQIKVQMGLVVTSGNNDSLCTAVFDNVIINGDSVQVGVEDNNEMLPTEFAIGNYPNPFNPTTTIRYDLPEAGVVRIQIYDIMGSLVSELVNGKKNAGSYNVVWNGKNSHGKQTASGIYLYRVQLNAKIKTAKMLLMK